MVSIGYLIIIVTTATGFFSAVRYFTFIVEGISIESLKRNFFMDRVLGRDRIRIKKREKETD
jgi:hypothetical protein